MMKIFAHRAIFNSKENTIDGIKFYVKNMINVELDLRKNNELYLAHEQNEKGDSFKEACKIFKNSNIQVALHIKEFKIVSELQKILKEYSLEQKCFLFMDDVKYQQLRKRISDNIEVATYMNKKNYSESKIIWCDELKEKWFNKKLISEFQKKEKELIAISPELISSVDMNQMKEKWEDLVEFGFNGICTNYPIELKKWIKLKGGIN
jgi:hypothetical protein